MVDSFMQNRVDNDSPYRTCDEISVEWSGDGEQTARGRGRTDIDELTCNYDMMGHTYASYH